MKKRLIYVVYDRRKRVTETGEANVEICINFSRNVRKFIILRSCNPAEWKHFKNSEMLKMEVAAYEQILDKMINNEEELTLDNFNFHLGVFNKPKRTAAERRYHSALGFIEFMKDQIKKERISPGTIAHKNITIDALVRFGKLNSFKDLTPINVKAFDDFLHNETERSLTTVNNYHKNVKKYIRLAFEMGYIPRDPYKSPLCRFPRGKSKERRPLTEEELVKLRELDTLSEKEEHVRDLFIFCAYTGLSYSDSQVFDYKTMTEKLKGRIYIDGVRVKTGNNFFTPILPPAMEVLKKYGYQLPHISNQKANDYLHLIESRLRLNKPLTTHVARHSFATLILSHDVPIENVGRMLGQTDIKTTLIYCKILKTTIERHAKKLASKLL